MTDSLRSSEKDQDSTRERLKSTVAIMEACSYTEVEISEFLRSLESGFNQTDAIEPSVSPAVIALNRAFNADRDAIYALICNQVPCNQALADDPNFVVDKPKVFDGGWNIGAIGLINGVLGELGLPLVSLYFSDQPTSDGRHELLGFQEYKPCP